MLTALYDTGIRVISPLVGKEIKILQGEVTVPQLRQDPAIPFLTAGQHQRPCCPLDSQGLHNSVEVVLDQPSLAPRGRGHPAAQPGSPNSSRLWFLHHKPEGPPRHGQVCSFSRVTKKAPGLDSCSTETEELNLP